MSSKHRKSPQPQMDRGDEPRDLQEHIDALEPADVVNLPAKVMGNMLSSWEQLPKGFDTPPVCTWSLETINGRAKLHQVLQGASDTLWDLIAERPLKIVVTDLAASWSEYELKDKPGEIQSGPMFHLIGPVKTYHSMSDQVYRSLQQLSWLEGPPPWNPGIVMVASRAPTRNKNTRIALMMVGRGNSVEDVAT